MIIACTSWETGLGRSSLVYIATLERITILKAKTRPFSYLLSARGAGITCRFISTVLAAFSREVELPLSCFWIALQADY